MFARIRFLLVSIVLLGAVAMVTAPGQGAGELKLRAALEQQLTTTDLSKVDAPLGKMALAACKLDPDACYEVVRDQIETRYEHHVIYSVYSVQGLGKSATCYGAFTQYFCPGGLVELGG